LIGLSAYFTGGISLIPTIIGCLGSGIFLNNKKNETANLRFEGHKENSWDLLSKFI
jgi:hypothetical protein